MKIGWLYDPGLPFSGVRPGDEDICRMKETGVMINTQNYSQRLVESFDCLVNLHGPYFIKPAWPYIKAHLEAGKGLVTLGGQTPFSLPVSMKDWQWRRERPQTAYHEELHIRHGHVIKKERYTRLEVNADLPLLRGFEDCFRCRDTLGFIVQFTHTKDIPADLGSSGPMDAVLLPLLTGLSADGRQTAAPVVMIENTKGIYEGGQWIFVNQDADEIFWGNGGILLLESLAGYAARGAHEIILRPNYASYYLGEKPTLLLQGQSFRHGVKKASIRLRLLKEGRQVYEKDVEMELSDEIIYRSLPLDLTVDKGLYEMEALVRIEGEGERILRNGFWGYDRELMESGEAISCGKDYFYKGNEPMPVVGMTYMQSDVHRKFIYLPNVYRWDRDFGEMKKAGINMVRTGIWTGHRTVMFNDGIASEEILRALDAFFLTAKKYDIPVVFNFFAFAPEMWEGINPYLDPRSIKAQKRFISSIVSRHVKSKGVSWDLINEPSVSNPRNLWRPAPNRDPYELAEWQKWLQRRHGSIEALQERWNCSPTEFSSFQEVQLPAEEDFSTRKDNPEPMKGQKAHDYILFTQYVMNRWAAEMVKTIRATGSRQLVTIGQDEALHAKRPSPFFYQEEVDYTTNHSWWQMDDLYWDSVFAKSPDKPNLIQETGIMYTQNARGTARRSEEELRNILERKYALAFAGDNAGAIHWIWNINIYMESLNEVNIGAVRADGTQKPEADVSYDFGHFITHISHLFQGRREAEVAVIYPYANDFSVRDYANEATKKLSRILGYGMHIPFKAYGEYHLEKLGREKLIILPSPRVLTDDAWKTVMDKVKEGSVLLITGPFSEDEYWGEVEERKVLLGLDTRIMNISREETLYIDGKPHRAAFGGDKLAWVDKELETSGTAALKTIPYGLGKVIWCPLPIEMNQEEQIIREVYALALEAAGISCPIEWIRGRNPGILAKKLTFEKGNLYIFVSEYGEDEELAVRDMETGRIYECMLAADRVILFATDREGNMIKAYRDQEVKVR
ncbi:MAG: beta-galactosidase [Clostridia bacterium]|jgi:hypothetical protein